MNNLIGTSNLGSLTDYPPAMPSMLQPRLNKMEEAALHIYCANLAAYPERDRQELMQEAVEQAQTLLMLCA